MKINRNYFLSQVIVNNLYQAGIRDVCISPGSRSTPLVFAFDENKKIKKHIIVEERVSGFFALGLSNSTGRPVALLCTSGTAVAEYYPAVIEAFQTRAKLIIITADRPEYLRNTGENQCINQENIYRNHIKGYFDPGLAELNVRYFRNLNRGLGELFSIMNCSDPGPAHLNVQLQKPFEPDSYTDEISTDLYKKLSLVSFKTEYSEDLRREDAGKISSLADCQNPLIIVGRLKVKDTFISHLLKTLGGKGFPVLADVTSQIKFRGAGYKNFIFNYDTLLRDGSFQKYYSPDLIIHIGGSVTSTVLIEYIRSGDCNKIAINRYGERVNPAISSDNTHYLSDKGILSFLSQLEPVMKNTKISDELQLLDNFVEKRKRILLNDSKLNEINIINKVLDFLPENSDIFIGNSLPVRDLDNFGIRIHKSINVYSNRGASGIDGIISTVNGISVGSGNRIYLILGDLSFLYDMNALIFLSGFKAKVTIIVINNNGGGIFGMLPVSNHQKQFMRYFRTPVEVNIGKLLNGMNIEHKEASGSSQLLSALNSFSRTEGVQVIEVKTDAEESKIIREKIRLFNL